MAKEVPPEGPSGTGPAGFVGFDPDRLAVVVASIRGAVDELRGLTSADPAAAAATTSMGAVRFELETTWLPVVVRVLGTTAMSGWAADAPGVMRTTAAHEPVSRHGLLGAPAAGPYAAFVNDVERLLGRIADGDLRAVDELWAVLHRRADDAEALAALLGALGTDGWWDAITILGGCTSELDATEALAAVDVLLGALAHAPDDGRFTPEQFGRTVVSRLSDGAALVDSEVRADPYSVAVTVLGGENLPEEFEVSAAVAAARFLIDSGPDVGGSLNEGWFLGGTPTGCLTVDPTRWLAMADDPLAYLVGLVSDDPAQARELLGDADVVDLVFARHRWSDDYTAMFHLLEVAVAGPDLTDPLRPASGEAAHAANVVVTQAVAYLAERRGFDPDSVSEPASVSAARVANAHLIAIEVAVNTPFEAAGDSSGSSPGIPVIPSPALDDATLRAPVLPVVEHVSMAPGQRVETALFELASVTLLVGAAGSTDAGIATLRAGTAQFYANCAGGAADRIDRYLDAETFPGFDATGTYVSAATWNAGTEGFIIQSVFGPDERAAADQDRRTRIWVSTLSGMLGSAAGELDGLSPFTVAIGPVASWIADQIATEQSGVVAEATSFARQSVVNIGEIYTTTARVHGLDVGGSASPQGPGLPPLAEAVVAVTDAVIYQPGDRITLDAGVIRDRLITAQTAEYVTVAAGRLR